MTRKARKSTVLQQTPVADGAEKEYRVQFLTSSRKYAEGSSAFKGLSPVDFYTDGSTYKYTYGSTEKQSEIEQTLKEVRRKFKDAFIVEFEGGRRIK